MRANKKNRKKIIIFAIVGLVPAVSIYNMISGQKAQIEALNQKLAEQQATSAQAIATAPTAAAVDKTITIMALSDIKAGEVITYKKIEIKDFNINDLPQGYFNNQNYVIGKIASRNILQGKIITSDDIISVDTSAINIPNGMRAITIPTSLMQGLASYIFVGAKIDIISTKAPPEIIAQNVKIIALESSLMQEQPAATTPPAAAATAAPAAPGTPAAPGAPAAPGTPVVATAPVVQPAAPIPLNANNKVSADKATGITILIPARIANRVIESMSAGKLQIITRGPNDNKLIASSSGSGYPNSNYKVNLPPPPKMTGSLPTLPGVIAAPEKPKKEVEVIEANKRRTESFDEPEKFSASSSKSSLPGIPSGSMKELLKLIN